MRTRRRHPRHPGIARLSRLRADGRTRPWRDATGSLSVELLALVVVTAAVVVVVASAFTANRSTLTTFAAERLCQIAGGACTEPETSIDDAPPPPDADLSPPTTDTDGSDSPATDPGHAPDSDHERGTLAAAPGGSGLGRPLDVFLDGGVDVDGLTLDALIGDGFDTRTVTARELADAGVTAPGMDAVALLDLVAPGRVGAETLIEIGAVFNGRSVRQLPQLGISTENARFVHLNGAGASFAGMSVGEAAGRTRGGLDVRIDEALDPGLVLGELGDDPLAALDADGVRAVGVHVDLLTGLDLPLGQVVTTDAADIVTEVVDASEGVSDRQLDDGEQVLVVVDGGSVSDHPESGPGGTDLSTAELLEGVTIPGFEPTPDSIPFPWLLPSPQTEVEVTNPSPSAVDATLGRPVGEGGRMFLRISGDGNERNVDQDGATDPGGSGGTFPTGQLGLVGGFEFVEDFLSGGLEVGGTAQTGPGDDRAETEPIGGASLEIGPDGDWSVGARLENLFRAATMLSVTAGHRDDLARVRYVAPVGEDSGMGQTLTGSFDVPIDDGRIRIQGDATVGHGPVDLPASVIGRVVLVPRDGVEVDVGGGLEGGNEVVEGQVGIDVPGGYITISGNAAFGGAADGGGYGFGVEVELPTDLPEETATIDANQLSEDFWDSDSYGFHDSVTLPELDTTLPDYSSISDPVFGDIYPGSGPVFGDIYPDSGSLDP